MLSFRVIGDWGPGQVRSTWTDRSSRPVVPELERLIDAAWSEALARPGVTLFDGPMCRLEAWNASPGRLDLTLSPTGYKTFFGTNLTNAALADRFGVDALANPVGVSAALETADGFLLLGRRNASVAYYPDRVHPFAGTLEPRDAAGWDPAAGNRGDATPGPNVFAAVRRELAEELAFTEADVAEARCVGIAEDAALRQPELIFLVKSTRTRRQVEAQLDRGEHRASYAVPAERDALEAAVDDLALTPVAVASLLLWGRVRFGAPWFEGRVRGLGIRLG